MEHNKVCLNCGKEVQQHFCSECGQSASTHRFSLKHIFGHDLIHGVFHFDKGFFYTAKELIVRPGYSIREYIEGKRVKHYNYIAFLLLLTAVFVFVLTSGNNSFFESMQMQDANLFTSIMQKYSKFSYLFAIPFSAITTMLCFPRARQNFAEHLVLNTYKSGGTLLITVVLSLLTHLVDTYTQGRIMLILIGVSPFIYSMWFYEQYFKVDYPHKLERTLRVMVAMVLIPALTAGLLLGYMYFFQREAAEQLIEGFLEMQKQNATTH